MLFLILVFAWLAAAPVAAEAIFLNSYIWDHDDPAFGGFSAIELSDDGRQFIAVSDRAHFATGMIRRTGDSIVDVQLDILTPLVGPDGAPLIDDLGDSEGLAISGDGTIYVSFESTHGLRAFADIDGRGGPLLTTNAFAAMQTNSSLEALAIDSKGALYTLPERSGRASRPFPVYRLNGGSWDRPFSVPRDGAYLPAGADIGPDDKLYILERDFIGIGFRSRVRRFSLDGSNEETVLETRLLAHDNLEGISVWCDDIGLRLTLISDDNFRSFQRTEIVEYRLTD